MLPALAAVAGLTTAGAVSATAATADIVYLVADLTGANEVRTAATPAGDSDGYGVEIVRVVGNEVRFAIAWANIATPSSSHIHSGITGVNGPVKVDYFSGTTLPYGVRAVTGRVTTPDTALLNAIKDDPGAFYANVHNVQYPGGAIRGQFRKLDVTDADIDMDELIGTGFLRAHATGAQEINMTTGDAGAGDPNGRGWAAVDAQGTRIAYALKWAGIQRPTAAHIHIGATGENGAVVVPLFEVTAGLPKSILGVGGLVRNLSSATLAGIRRTPGGFYVNIHNAEFLAGAVRGQLAYVPDL
ncbi:MAG: CHRD domain-containing protein [Mycobacteriales bacterium]